MQVESVKKMTPKDVMKLLKDNGWKVTRINGSHHIMKHPTKPGRPVVPMHNKELKPGTLDNILRQAGLK